LIDINKLPTGWSIKSLSELCILNPKHNNNLLDELEVSFVPMAEVDEKTGTISPDVECRKLGEIRKGYTHFANGDVIFAKITPCMENGKSAIAENLCNGLACGSTEFYTLRSYGAISPQYLHPFLRQNSYIQNASMNMTGVVGHRRVTKDFILSTSIPLPPLNEQKRIVTKIEALQTRSTAVKEELKAIKPLLNQFRQSVLAAAFRGDLTKDWREQNPDVEPASKIVESNSDLVSSNLPISWYQALIGDVVENLKYGTSKKCSYKIDGIPVLRIPNVVDGTIDHSDLKYAELSDKELDKLRLTPGDVLMIRSNGSVSLVGRTAIIDEAERGFAYAGYLIRLRPNRTLVYPKYLNLWFSSYEIRLQIEIPLRSTSGVNNINSDETKKLHIPLAPLEEQKEIVRRIESLFKLADSIEQQYQQAEADLKTLNQSILAKAFRGELVPQDPNDEPASVLLERIKAERQRDKAKPKKSETEKKRSSKKEDKQLEIPGI
jgi:type I restriction enzyme S subunit